MMQRFFDILFSILGLLILSPLLVIVIIILIFSGEGEIFYRQVRIGKKGEPFELIKFATMLKDSPNIATGTITIKNDPRVLPFGQFLRKSKINELPQLFNILLGDMSLIGPRPLTKNHFDSYTPQHQKIICAVKPGLSGIGSIVFRAEEEMLHLNQNPRKFYSENISPYKASLEIWYVENQGLMTYFTLIFLTLWVVFFSQSSLVWKIFKTLPPPPLELERFFKQS